MSFSEPLGLQKQALTFNIKENPYTQTRNYYNKQMEAFDSLQKKADVVARTNIFIHLN